MVEHVQATHHGLNSIEQAKGARSSQQANHAIEQQWLVAEVFLPLCSQDKDLSLDPLKLYQKTGPLFQIATVEE